MTEAHAGDRASSDAGQWWIRAHARGGGDGACTNVTEHAFWSQDREVVHRSHGRVPVCFAYTLCNLAASLIELLAVRLMVGALHADREAGAGGGAEDQIALHARV